MANTTKTQKERLIAALTEGRSVSPSFARSRWGTVNLRAAICKLRNAGYNIVTNGTNGRVTYALANTATKASKRRKRSN
jgi:hypothetical protein